MKIYTRTGDQGQTSLLGGSRVPKDHLRIEAYGTIDELNSHLGLLRDWSTERHKSLLQDVQTILFSIGSRLASGSEAEADTFKVPPVTDEQVAALEKVMDELDKELPVMRNFILPGGHPTISQAHICRTVCRRAEPVRPSGRARGGAGRADPLPQPPLRPPFRGGTVLGARAQRCRASVEATRLNASTP